MFCPKCGKSDQTPESFCRKCGHYLPDFDKLKPAVIPPEQHLAANMWLSAMTALIALTVAIALYSVFLGRPDTHWIVYLTAGFLTAMFSWQVQVFIRTLKLKNHFKRRRNDATDTTAIDPALDKSSTRGSLPEADFDSVVPFSVTHKTTKKLKTPRS